MADDFPADVRLFIAQNIESLAQLEVLLLLHGEKHRLWSVPEISKVLYILPEMSATILQDLSRRGFTQLNDSSYHYQAANSDIDQLIGRLDAMYRLRRVAVTTEIYSKPNAPLKSFAEAFRLRREQ